MKKKQLRIILILAAIAIIFLGIKILLPKQEIPVIINTSPVNQQSNLSLETQIAITFDKEITLSDWQVTTFPTIKFNLKQDKNSLVILPTEKLTGQTEYKIELKNKQIANFLYSFSFITQKEPFIPTSTEGKGVGTPNFYQSFRQKIDNDYPLFDEVPYISQNWNITYTDALKLKVTLKKDTPEIRQEVLDWIMDKGVDPSTHKIDWKLQK
ncbi:MAG: Ig-like domain-containing protein [Patescibacteria group bacterium]|nr:Ig-like domain-containing protein [Patescibacteria group bacterium]